MIFVSTSHQKGDSCYQKGDSCYQKGNLCYQKGNSCHQKGNSCHQKGNSCHQKGNSCHQKGNSCHQKGNSCYQIRVFLCRRLRHDVIFSVLFLPIHGSSVPLHRLTIGRPATEFRDNLFSVEPHCFLCRCFPT